MSINQLINPVKGLDIVVNTINGNPPDVDDSPLKSFSGISFIATDNPDLTPSISYRNAEIYVQDKKVEINSDIYDAKLVKGTMGFKCVNNIVPAGNVEVKTNGLNLSTTLNQRLNKSVLSIFTNSNGGYVANAVVNGASDITFTITLKDALAVNTGEFVMDFEVLCVETNPN